MTLIKSISVYFYLKKSLYLNSNTLDQKNAENFLLLFSAFGIGILIILLGWLVGISSKYFHIPSDSYTDILLIILLADLFSWIFFKKADFPFIYFLKPFPVSKKSLKILTILNYLIDPKWLVFACFMLGILIAKKANLTEKLFFNTVFFYFLIAANQIFSLFFKILNGYHFMFLFAYSFILALIWKLFHFSYIFVSILLVLFVIAILCILIWIRVEETFYRR